MNLFIGGAGVARDDHGVHGWGRIERGQTVPSEQAGDARRFRRDDAHTVVAVAAQKPPDRPVAESAVAVVDNQQAGAELRKVAHIGPDERTLAGDAASAGSTTILNKR